MSDNFSRDWQYQEQYVPLIKPILGTLGIATASLELDTKEPGIKFRQLVFDQSGCSAASPAAQFQSFVDTAGAQ
jgi:hypothetical protein